MKNLTAILLVLLGLGTGPVAAQDGNEPPPPKPDLWTSDISAPDGIVKGSANKVRVVVENLKKDSRVEGKVKIELVVIQADPTDRTSYFSEVDGMGYGEKRETIFEGIEAKNDDSVRLLTILDPEQAIKESDEENNRRIFKVWIKKPAPETTETEPRPEGEPEPQPEPQPTESEPTEPEQPSE